MVSFVTRPATEFDLPRTAGHLQLGALGPGPAEPAPARDRVRLRRKLRRAAGHQRCGLGRPVSWRRASPTPTGAGVPHTNFVRPDGPRQAIRPDGPRQATRAVCGRCAAGAGASDFDSETGSWLSVQKLRVLKRAPEEETGSPGLRRPREDQDLVPHAPPQFPSPTCPFPRGRESCDQRRASTSAPPSTFLLQMRERRDSSFRKRRGKRGGEAPHLCQASPLASAKLCQAHPKTPRLQSAPRLCQAARGSGSSGPSDPGLSHARPRSPAVNRCRTAPHGRTLESPS
jgi:hypothetical protein